MRANRLIQLAVLWLILAGAFVRVWGIGHYWFSPDEMMHLRIAGQPTLGRLWIESHHQVHPPLLYLAYHPILRMSRDIVWLRSWSVAAGLAGMLVLFFVARKAAGNLAGIVALALAAVSYGHVLISQVVRHYSLLLLFLSLSFWFFLAWRQSRTPRLLVGFAASALLAVSVHYSGVIPLAGIGLGWMFFLASRQSPRREYARVGLAFLPAVAAVGLFFASHLSTVFSTGFYDRIQADYLSPYYATTPAQFGKNLRDLFGYLFLSPEPLLPMAATVAGLFALWARGGKDLALSIAATFVLLMTLNLAGKYPMGGIRHCIFLLPLAALAIGAGAQWMWDWLSSPGHLGQRLTARGNLIAGLGLAFLVVSTLPLLYWMRETDFLRRHDTPSWMEFPLTRDDYQMTLELLRRKVMAGDLILVTDQTSYYLRFESRREATDVGNGLMKIRYSGLDFYFAPATWTCEGVGAWELVSGKLRARPEYPRARRLWLVNLGWGRGFPLGLSKQTALERPGASVYLRDLF